MNRGRVGGVRFDGVTSVGAGVVYLVYPDPFEAEADYDPEPIGVTSGVISVEVISDRIAVHFSPRSGVTTCVRSR